MSSTYSSTQSEDQIEYRHIFFPNCIVVVGGGFGLSYCNVHYDENSLATNVIVAC